MRTASPTDGEVLRVNHRRQVWLDVAVFVEAAEAARTTNPATLTDVDLDDLARGASLRRGPLLAGCYEDWAGGRHRMTMTIPMPRIPRPGCGDDGDDEDELVWYVSYGSNMLPARLGYYLAGGTPPWTARAHPYPGCRDRRPPRRTVPVTLPGTVYFALESKVWTGGMAFYDPDAPGGAAARAYLITAGQFADIAAQEMHRPTGGDLDLAEVLSTGRAQLGPGRYETLVLAGHRDGHPLLTFTAPWRVADVQTTAPSAAYLGMLAAGLRDSHGWSSRRVADYLSAIPGARGAWRSADVERLLDSRDVPPGVGSPVPGVGSPVPGSGSHEVPGGGAIRVPTVRREAGNDHPGWIHNPGRDRV